MAPMFAFVDRNFSIQVVCMNIIVTVKSTKRHVVVKHTKSINVSDVGEHSSPEQT